MDEHVDEHVPTKRLKYSDSACSHVGYVFLRKLFSGTRVSCTEQKAALLYIHLDSQQVWTRVLYKNLRQ